MRLVRAAGGLLWRDGARGPELAVVHRPRRSDWSLPKGKLEPGEPWRAAALREVEEETGIPARAGRFAGFTAYAVASGPKLVLFWNMRAAGPSSFVPNAEVDAVEWLAPEDAIARLDHRSERRLVARAARRGRRF